MKNENTDSLRAEARSMKLVYGSDSQPGYTRKLRGRHFIFFDTEGKKVTDENEIKRIRSLALPPAWTRVWISPKANSHLQATGIDAAGRKQYKYHSQWSHLRNERKHNRMGEFAKALPIIRQQLEDDLRVSQFSREKVLALAISLLDKTFIRVGNSAYTKLYGTFGLTSLRNQHLKISGNKMTLAFKGKKGVFQEIKLTHTRLIRLLKKLKDIPGQELFQYYDTDGTKKSIGSEDINEYLEKCTGKEFTAKDFRTWWGTVIAAKHLADNEKGLNENGKNIPDTLDFVAMKLGNTRAVCKKYYIHPQLFKSYEEGKLEKYLSRIRRIRQNKKDEKYRTAEEAVMANFILKECCES